MSEQCADIFSYQLRVGPDLIDPLYQHVHHAKVFEILEQGRLEFLKAVGAPIEDFSRQGLFWVIWELQTKFKREIRAADIRVTCERCAVAGRVLTINQRILDERDKELVRARVDLMLLSREKGRAIAIPEPMQMKVAPFL